MNNIQSLFPILNREVNGNRLVYLDSGATTQRPKQVIDAITNYYKEFNSNPHRGAYSLSVEATEGFEESREVVRNFINAKSISEIIFTKSTTESINLVASSYGMNFINEGDEIVILISEHHSNLIPWQNVCKVKKAKLKYIYLDKENKISVEAAKEVITDKTKLVAMAMISNVLGNIHPVKEIIKISHEVGAKVLIDAAQAVAHMKVDVRELDADFLVFSGHKMYGPMGIGVLYGKEEILNEMPPYLTGGDMVEYVYEDSYTFGELPYKFEGGTQNVEGAIGIAEAIRFIQSIGFEKIHEIENEVMTYCYNSLKDLPYINIVGTKDLYNRSGVVSFTVDDIHPHDVAQILDSKGVCIRVGNHCAQPLMRYLGINSTCRASFSVINTKEDIDAMIAGIKEVRRVFGYES